MPSARLEPAEMNERPRWNWTTPKEIHERLRRMWEQGSLLSESLRAESTTFPWQHKLRVPDARSLRADFEAVRHWIRELEEGSRSVHGHGYEIVWSEINHRQLGRNRLPTAVIVPDLNDALALLGVAQEAERFRQLAALILDWFPELAEWLNRRPFLALEHADEWQRILPMLRWMRTHPRPGVYLRQLEIPGVDSKFIETHKNLLSELLDVILPTDAVARDMHPIRQFELRYGLLAKQPLVRFRLLDPEYRLQTLEDVATPASQFARLELPIANVFITENETNGLAFPACPRSIVVFGLGYGLARLAEVGWLSNKVVYYWGDIDTHGFAILDRLRTHVPHARSFLMDRETLGLHRSLWSHEPSQYVGELLRLTAEEGAVFDELKTNRLGSGVRLEQERIAYAWVRQALTSIVG